MIDFSIGSCPDQFQLKFQHVKHTTVLISFLDDCEVQPFKNDQV